MKLEKNKIIFIQMKKVELPKNMIKLFFKNYDDFLKDCLWSFNEIESEAYYDYGVVINETEDWFFCFRDDAVFIFEKEDLK